MNSFVAMNLKETGGEHESILKDTAAAMYTGML